MSDDADDTREKEMADTCSNCDRKLRTLDEASYGICVDCAEAEFRGEEPTNG